MLLTYHQVAKTASSVRVSTSSVWISAKPWLRSKCRSPPIAVVQVSHYFLPYTEEYEGIDKPAVYYLGDNWSVSEVLVSEEFWTEIVKGLLSYHFGRSRTSAKPRISKWAWSDGKGGHRKRVATAHWSWNIMSPGLAVSAGHYRRLLHILTGGHSWFCRLPPSLSRSSQCVHPPAQYAGLVLLCRPLAGVPAPNRLQPSIRLFSSWVWTREKKESPLRS